MFRYSLVYETAHRKLCRDYSTLPISTNVYDRTNLLFRIITLKYKNALLCRDNRPIPYISIHQNDKYLEVWIIIQNGPAILVRSVNNITKESEQSVFYTPEQMLMEIDQFYEIK